MVAADTLAALTWDPQIRGALIVLTAVVILCGSVFMLLATNSGLRIGFLLAAAGLMGWMASMGLIWTIYGIGLKGPTPFWKVEEVVTGDLAELATVEAVEGFPRGWKKLPQGDPVLGDAQGAADKVLSGAGEGEGEGGGHGGGAQEGGGEEGGGAETTVKPIFDSPSDYVVTGGYRKGGEDYYIPGGFLERSRGFLKGWFHKPHYVIVEATPTIELPETGGPPPPPTPDPSAPRTSVIMVRDLGSLRLPSFVLTVFSGLLFGLICHALHRRDKAIRAMRADVVPASS